MPLGKVQKKGSREGPVRRLLFASLKKRRDPDLQVEVAEKGGEMRIGTIACYGFVVLSLVWTVEAVAEANAPIAAINAVFSAVWVWLAQRSKREA